MNDAKQWRESVANEIHDAVRAANGNISYGAITDALFAKVPVLAAAPELLEACEQAEALLNNKYLTDTFRPEIGAMLAKVIRKAEGRS